MKRLIRLFALATLTIGLQVAAVPAAQASAGRSPQSNIVATPNCHLGNGIKHVINVVFDNVHLTRDNRNVPSDLEQMPHLLNFIERNGTMVTHNYTPLISHTANDIVTTLTGLYPDQQGLAVANSYSFYKPNGQIGGFPSAFQYWTDKVFGETPAAYNNVTANGVNTPAPWVPFTRNGCDVGGVSTANIELENKFNIATVFGTSGSEWTEAQSNPGQATADFIGIAIHCAKNDPVCTTSPHVSQDVLPTELGGYSGFPALFGHKYVVPAIAPAGLKDLDGNPIPGFPGFGGISAAQSLAYVAAMEENGVPVTYAYISDAHDNHGSTGFQGALGPGEAPYVAQLKAYDRAFDNFFKRLATDGITPQNTIFNFSSDENDHFAGKTAHGCNGTTTLCTYDHTFATGNIGEISTNMTDLMVKAGVNTSFDLHFDSAPAVYLIPRTSRTDQVTRQFEQAAATLVDLKNYVTGKATPLMQRMADPVEMQILHMITGDPARTPTFIYFANPDYFILTSGFSPFDVPQTSDFIQNPAFAWQHGDFQPDIVKSWLGLVGPGVRHLGVDQETWADHADVRPTILFLTGLQDDYTSEGRVLIEDIKTSALPASLRAHRDTLLELGKTYKQINAPVGQLGLDSLKVSTRAVASNSPGDATYTQLENKLISVGQQRDSIAGQIITILNAAEFGHQAINEQKAEPLIEQGQDLLDQVSELAE